MSNGTRGVERRAFARLAGSLAIFAAGCATVPGQSSAGIHISDSGANDRDGARVDAGGCGEWSTGSCGAGTRRVPGTCECTPCVTTLACPNDACPAATITCSTYGACSSNADCDSSTFCNRSGKCEVSFAGAPCGSNANCAGDTCENGYCGCLVMRATQLGQCSYDVVGIAIDGGTAGPLSAYASTWVAYVGQELVPQDPSHADGWDYDKLAGRAMFYGGACTRLSGEPATNVTIVGADCPLGPR